MKTEINYNEIAKNYSTYRNASQRIVQHISEKVNGNDIKLILEIGCGTADYLCALSSELGSEKAYGLDNSERMIEEADKKYRGLILQVADIENKFPYDNQIFDFGYSVDVIHYVQDLNHCYSELYRVMRCNGIVATITDSEEDIKNRTMSKYFPESIDIEMKRYHSIDKIKTVMALVGFKEIGITHTNYQEKMTEETFVKYLNKAYSAIQLVSNINFIAGIEAMKLDMSKGKCVRTENYTYVWGIK